MPDTEKHPLIQQILSSFDALRQRHEAEDDEERRWLIQNCRNPELKAMFPELSVLMLHVLDRIGRSEPINGITIAKQMSISKGTVSKITRKLVASNLVQTESLPNNKKEVLFSLTSLGQDLFELHKAMHQQIEMGVVLLLQQYDVQKLGVLAEFIEHFSRVNFLEDRPEADGTDE